jgi:CDP-glucose 4,6-dehydratase
VERRRRTLENLVMQAGGFWAGKRVLVLGHTGFKGSWLSLWLHRKGARVFGLSLPPEDRPSLYADAALGALVEEVSGDIRDLDTVQRAFASAEPEIVFHLAAQSLVRRSYREPVATFATNVMGTVHVLAAAQATPSVSAVIIVTTDKCYENREWVWAYRENEPLGGHDPYSSSKACAELATAAWRSSFCGPGADRKLGIASVRAGNVIGGGDWAEDRLVPDCLRALIAGRPIGIRNPHATRPWQHVLDPLGGYMTLAECLAQAPEDYAEAWNFGPMDGDVQPVDWIASRIVERWGGAAAWEKIGIEQPPHEASFLKVDASKARARLGWRQKLPLEAGLDWSVDWYRAFAGGAPARDLMADQIARFETL